MTTKQLSVRLYGEPVGILEQTLTGKMQFIYSNTATEAVSLAMPIREQPYDEFACEAFFGGLLPESDNAKKAIGRQYGISYNNSFALLKAIGYDCAGAISFHEKNEPIVSQRSVALDGKIVTEDDLYAHIKALPKKPLFLGFEGLRLSLAGVHDKAAVCIIDGQIALPQHGCPTTHILKPAVPDLEGIIENEYLCLQSASHAGLSVPNVEIRQVKDISYLLIERYDRHVQKNKIARIHQEDFCQALGIVSTRKYQSEGGPSLKQCFELLNNTTQPAISRNMLAAGMVYNFLICNMDAHGKNFSLLHSNPSHVSLAPFYDMLCTELYPTLTSKMAMKIGRKYEIQRVLPNHWEQLCKDINYSYPALKRLIKKQGESLLSALERNKEFYIETTRNTQIIHKIIEIITKNITRTLQRFG